MKPERNSLVVFFRYLIIGFLVSSFKNNIIGIPPLQVLNNLFLSFLYNFIIGIWVGLAALFGNELFFYIKKNVRNERHRNLYRCY